jgi:hypothetical protein
LAFGDIRLTLFFTIFFSQWFNLEHPDETREEVIDRMIKWTSHPAKPPALLFFYPYCLACCYTILVNFPYLDIRFHPQAWEAHDVFTGDIPVRDLRPRGA